MSSDERNLFESLSKTINLLDGGIVMKKYQKPKIPRYHHRRKTHARLRYTALHLSKCKCSAIECGFPTMRYHDFSVI